MRWMTAIVIGLGVALSLPAHAALSVLTGVGTQGNSTTITTGSIDTTTATLIVCVVTKDSGATFATTVVTDSKGNTYTTPATVEQGSSHRHYRAENPTVGSGHTFTLNMNGTGIGSIACLPIVGTASSGTVDQTAQNDDGGPTTTHQSPSATTTQADEILIGSLEAGASTETPVAAGSFTCVYCQPGSGSTALIGMAYRIVSATGNYTSHFTTAGSVWAGNALSTYKEAVAANVGCLLYQDGISKIMHQNGIDAVIQQGGTLSACVGGKGFPFYGDPFRPIIVR